jgi:hypothetical protein
MSVKVGSVAAEQATVMAQKGNSVRNHHGIVISIILMDEEPF